MPTTRPAGKPISQKKIGKQAPGKEMENRKTEHMNDFHYYFDVKCFSIQLRSSAVVRRSLCSCLLHGHRMFIHCYVINDSQGLRLLEWIEWKSGSEPPHPFANSACLPAIRSESGVKVH